QGAKDQRAGARAGAHRGSSFGAVLAGDAGGCGAGGGPGTAPEPAQSRTDRTETRRAVSTPPAASRRAKAAQVHPAVELPVDARPSSPEGTPSGAECRPSMVWTASARLSASRLPHA